MDEKYIIFKLFAPHTKDVYIGTTKSTIEEAVKSYQDKMSNVYKNLHTARIDHTSIQAVPYAFIISGPCHAVELEITTASKLSARLRHYLSITPNTTNHKYNEIKVKGKGSVSCSTTRSELASKLECECGGIYTERVKMSGVNKRLHNKTRRHQEWLSRTPEDPSTFTY